MARPRKCRFIGNIPQARIFHPQNDGKPGGEPLILGFEELEALRLGDFECMKQEDAAMVMDVSRATFGRIIEKARYKIADALLNGKTIVIEGGDFCHKTPVNAIGEDGNEYFVIKHRKCLACAKYREFCEKPHSRAELINKHR